ncbi:hypothetical protein SAMN05421839_1034 [Halolactibacillus halophilus]|uniref:Uncharacterized protein n=1 Tax=Halolactibacillus halophilus TaxID=306540 RepID=A0A1I5LVD1_9BACI|nr:hypothetical protein SAMN05421839_1034 [Halolactibacillus halophilus]
MTYVYVGLGIILVGSSIWGWTARYKWAEEQANKLKD